MIARIEQLLENNKAFVTRHMNLLSVPQTSMINNNDAILEVCKFHNGVVGQPARAVAA